MDNVRFQGLGEFVQRLHKNGQHYVPIIDAGIKPGSEVFEVFLKNNAFILSAKTQDILIG